MTLSLVVLLVLFAVGALVFGVVPAIMDARRAKRRRARGSVSITAHNQTGGVLAAEVVVRRAGGDVHRVVGEANAPDA